jgi:hypothetical protein
MYFYPETNVNYEIIPKFKLVGKSKKSMGQSFEKAEWKHQAESMAGREVLLTLREYFFRD